jgi:tetratricopeptide (TPR) repeat protein
MKFNIWHHLHSEKRLIQNSNSMKTIEIPAIGKVQSCSRAKNLYYFGRWISSPLFLIGGLILGYAFYLSISEYSNNTHSIDPLYLILLIGAGGVLIGLGSLIRMVLLKSAGRYFQPYDWFEIMNTFLGEGKNESAYMAATNLVKCNSNTIPEMLIISTGHLILAEKHGKIDHWNKLISILDKIIEEGYNHTSVKTDKAFALENLSKYEEALIVCNDVLSADADPHAYLIKTNCLIKLNRLELAASNLDELEKLSINSKNNDQINEILTIGRKNIQDASIENSNIIKFHVINNIGQIENLFNQTVFLIVYNFSSGGAVSETITDFKLKALPGIRELFKNILISIAWFNIGVDSEITQYLKQKGITQRGCYLIKQGVIVKYKSAGWNSPSEPYDFVYLAKKYLKEGLIL